LRSQDVLVRVLFSVSAHPVSTLGGFTLPSPSQLPTVEFLRWKGLFKSVSDRGRTADSLGEVRMHDFLPLAGKLSAFFLPAGPRQSEGTHSPFSSFSRTRWTVPPLPAPLHLACPLFSLFTVFFLPSPRPGDMMVRAKGKPLMKRYPRFSGSLEYPGV